jgi:DinB family protein
MASDRATALADDFSAANAEAMDFVRRCTAAEWTVAVPGEEWPVGVVLHHVAVGHGHGVRWLHDMASGEGVTDTAEGIDRENAVHALRMATVGRDETLALLEQNGTRLEAALRALRDEELDRTASFGPAGGRAMPTEALAAVAARHTREHLAHAREAVGS